MKLLTNALTKYFCGLLMVGLLIFLLAETVVRRITGDGAKKDLIAPLWSADKKKVLHYLNTHLQNLQ